MYKLVIPERVEKQLQKIDPRFQRAIDSALDRLCQFPKLGMPLRGELKGYFRLRVSRYRIVYRFDHKKKTIYLVAIAHRRVVYKRK